MHKRQYSEAVKLLEPCQSEEALFMCACCCLMLGSLQECRAFLQRVQSKESLVLQSICERREGNLASALEIVSSCVETYPDY